MWHLHMSWDYSTATAAWSVIPGAIRVLRCRSYQKTGPRDPTRCNAVLVRPCLEALQPVPQAPQFYMSDVLKLQSSLEQQVFQLLRPNFGNRLCRISHALP